MTTLSLSLICCNSLLHHIGCNSWLHYKCTHTPSAYYTQVLGMDEESFTRAFLRMPNFILLDTENKIQPTVDYFVREVGGYVHGYIMHACLIFRTRTWVGMPFGRPDLAFEISMCIKIRMNTYINSGFRNNYANRYVCSVIASCRLCAHLPLLLQSSALDDRHAKQRA